MLSTAWSRRTLKFYAGVSRRWLSNSPLGKVRRAPPDKILGLTEHFNRDTNPKKVNLTVGIYKDDHGHVTTFPSVAKAQRIVDSHEELNKNLSYLPINGNEVYSKRVLDFLYRESCPDNAELLDKDKISFVQTLSGTGAVAIASKFLSAFISKDVWLPNYSWANHQNIFSKNGFENIHLYSYYDLSSGQVMVEKWLQELEDAVGRTDNVKTPQAILLHACCHNPTGVDPTREEWHTIIDKIHELNMIPIIDMAYQGLESGNLIDDAYLLRMCLAKGGWSNGLYLCQSFAKDMGLYGEGVGSLSIVLPPAARVENKLALDSQLKPIIRSIYSSPPGYGCRVAKVVLSNEALKQQWFRDVQNMVQRLHGVRHKLYENLQWPDLVNFEKQHGMFYFTRFKPKQVNELKEKYSIYLTNDGRLSLSGVNSSNIDYLSTALGKVSEMK
ncbi:aspartate transaminase AAT1 KNAG_0A06470 [Huiozyma naganishii CBS 8797]|uniref:Aminotransferase class I/classII large domain-containing protein n=1 Tax=Huiozyma naganishii (strain ATCC MYA-139 / BCRC 22969 / CBS 8797 / KCTC 17520 / NBRC 10181 / NCYC 3082 / Yp74L-3) TaxID=1071383 RepID=J7R0H7_HUIN7|nr:hypothetical protein KNAG_0A06470 [Kazachstania naganishii CBS 8797]CCK68305.1 hypothetical protein KNAG_0A06470 [Kazachstania naganishii CBS 8797]